MSHNNKKMMRASPILKQLLVKKIKKKKLKRKQRKNIKRNKRSIANLRKNTKIKRIPI